MAFVGLDPQPYESGRSVHKRATISKMGGRSVRRYLYLGALGGVRGKNVLRTFYKRLVSRGKAKRLALVAAAHKILIWAWAVFAKDVDFDPARFPQEALPPFGRHERIYLPTNFEYTRITLPRVAPGVA